MAEKKEPVDPAPQEGAEVPVKAAADGGADAKVEEVQGAGAPVSDEQVQGVPQMPTGEDDQGSSWFPKIMTGFLNNVTMEGVVVDNTVDDSAAPFGEGVQKTAEAMAKEMESVSRDVTKNVALVGEELNKGWAGLNNFIDGVLNEGGLSGPEQVQAIFNTNFPDHAEEDVVDCFRCAIVQKYRCYHNSSTPEKSFTFDGSIFITVNLAAFWAEEDEGGFGATGFPVIVAFKDVEKVQKGQPGMLRLLMKSKASFIFNAFETETDFTGALSLLEHMTETANNPSAAAEDAKAPETTPQVEKPAVAAEEEKR